MIAHRVGIRRILYEDSIRRNWDETRPRPLVTDIWYPAADTATETDIFIGHPENPLFRAGKFAGDAEITSTQALFPLVLLSHGTGGLSLQLGWLASQLASHGYIVAAVNHHGNNGLEPYTPQGFLHYWERPKDLSTVLDQLLSDTYWRAYINLDRIGVAGFSLGGYTALALAGCKADVQLFLKSIENAERDFSKEIPPEFPEPTLFMSELESLAGYASLANASYDDKRIKATFAIAPVLGEAFSPDGLALVKAPVQIVVGEADENAPAAVNASHYAKHIPGAELTLLKNVSHYAFLAEATEAGKQILPMFCLDANGVDRVSVHQEVGGLATNFFDRYLIG